MNALNVFQVTTKTKKDTANLASVQLYFRTETPTLALNALLLQDVLNAKTI